MGNKTKPKRYFSMHVDEEEKVADIYVYGDIVVPEWQWYESDTSGFSLAKEIEALEDVETINVFINSYGGHVSEGLAIYNALRRHGAKIVTYCDGFACSAASLVFMAGEERIMSNASVLLMHNASGLAWGTAEAIRKEAEDLEALSEASMNAYLNHVNITADEMKALMAEDRFMKSDEALEKGFATKVSQEEEAKVASMAVRKDFVARLTGEPKSMPMGDIVIDEGTLEKVMSKALKEYSAKLEKEVLEGDGDGEPKGLSSEDTQPEEPKENKPLELLKGFFNIKNEEE